MGEWVIEALLIGVTAWLIWFVLQPRYVFEIRVEGGEPFVRKGKVTAAFLGEVAAVCRETGVSGGWVGGVLHGKRVLLRFSRHFPPGARQRLRNEWALVG